MSDINPVFDPIFTNNGIKPKTFLENKDIIIDRYKKIYGDDINVDQNTQDGQLIGILARIKSDFDQELGKLPALLNPATSFGRWLDLIGSIRGGISRLPGRNYIVEQKFYIKPEKTDRFDILSLSTGAGAKFTTISNHSFLFNPDAPNEVFTITLQSSEPVEAPEELVPFQLEGDLAEWIEFKRDGQTDYSNPTKVYNGESEETEGAYRTRLINGISGPIPQAKLPAMVQAVNDPEISDMVIYERMTEEQTGLPTDLPVGYTSYVFKGGDEDKIATLIANNRLAGSGPLWASPTPAGSVVNVNYEYTQPNGTKSVYPITFNQASSLRIYVRMSVISEYALKLEDITAYLVANLPDYKIGRTVTATALACIVAEHYPLLQVVDAEVSLNKADWSRSIQLSEINEYLYYYGSIDKADIEITRVDY